MADATWWWQRSRTWRRPSRCRSCGSTSRNHVSQSEYLATAVASPLITPGTHANVYISLSKALRFLGRADDAAKMLEDALDDLGSHTLEAAGLRLRLPTYLSYALTDLGQLE